MLAYAAPRRQVAARSSSPNAMLVIVSIHIAAIAALMSARMDLPTRLQEGPLHVIFVPPSVEPPPQPVEHPIARPNPAPAPTPLPPMPLPPIDGPTVTPGPIDDGAAVIGGGGAGISPGLSNPIRLAPIHHDARLLTPQSELKPPYPASKLLNEEEATLTLRLTIDDGGRVVAVDPVGPADREFLNAARRHLIAHWRYQPASDDGRSVASSTVITLRFQLDG